MKNGFLVFPEGRALEVVNGDNRIAAIISPNPRHDNRHRAEPADPLRIALPYGAAEVRGNSGGDSRTAHKAGGLQDTGYSKAPADMQCDRFIQPGKQSCCCQLRPTAAFHLVSGLDRGRSKRNRQSCSARKKS